MLVLVNRRVKRESEAEENVLQSVNFLLVATRPIHRLLRLKRDNICKMFSRVQNEEARA